MHVCFFSRALKQTNHNNYQRGTRQFQCGCIGHVWTFIKIIRPYKTSHRIPFMTQVVFDWVSSNSIAHTLLLFILIPSCSNILIMYCFRLPSPIGNSISHHLFQKNYEPCVVSDKPNLE